MVSVRGFYRFEQSLPKDPFPISRIDQLVDATMGHPEFPGRLPGLPSDTTVTIRPGEDGLLCPQQELSLLCDTFRP